LKEFYDPQDDYQFTRTGPDKAILKCRFVPHRFDVRRLVLAIPPDVAIEWNVLQAVVADSTQQNRVTRAEILDTSSWVSVCRPWLSDIPLAVVSFPATHKARIREPRGGSPADVGQITTATREIQAPTASLVVVREATFELVFSREFGATGNSVSTGTETVKDSFGRLAQILVANPEDLPGVRGIPASADKNSEAAGFESLPLGIRRDGAKLPSVRILTRGRGIARITGRELAKAGFDLTARPLPYLTLFHNGVPCPVEIISADPERMSEQDWLWFPYEESRSEETLDEVFFLAWGDTPGTRIEKEDNLDAPSQEGSAAQAPRAWDFRMFHLEQNNTEISALNELVAGAITVGWHEFNQEHDKFVSEFDLPELEVLAPGTFLEAEARIPFQVRVLSADNFLGSCSLSLTLNGIEVGNLHLKAHSREILAARISPAILRPRGNRLALAFTGRLRALNTEMHGPILDWMRLWYPARANVYGGLVVNNPIPESFSAGWNAPGSVRWNVPNPIDDWRFIVFDQSPGQTCTSWKLPVHENSFEVPPALMSSPWWIANLSQAQPPRHMESATFADTLHGHHLQSDLLVIADSRFVPQVENYLERIHGTQWTWKVASTQQIYDEFSDGHKSIEALRRFCDYAFHHYRAPRPQFLWLVGESRWDPRNELGSQVEDLVPSPLMKTRAVLHSNDQWYACLHGADAFPDLLVSRLAVSTTAELDNYLAKVTEDQEAPLGWWRAKDLFLTDDGFITDMKKYLSDGLSRCVLPKSIVLENYPRDPFRKFEAVGKEGKEARGVRADVVSEWSQGARLVEYAGHGGITVWSPDAIFKGLNRADSDVDRLSNQGRYSFLMTRSCLSASVNWPTFPGEVSVAEALCKAAGKGAIGVLGSSGTEFARCQERYGAFYRAALFNHRLDLWAEIRAYAHCQYILQSMNDVDTANQYMLHGDPLLSVNLPEPLEITCAEWVHDQDQPSLEARWSAGVSRGQGQVRVLDGNDILFESAVFPIGNVSGEIKLPVPQDLPFRAHLHVAVYLWDEAGRNDAFGAARLTPMSKDSDPWGGSYQRWFPGSDGSLDVSEIQFDPKDPVLGEQIVFSLEVHNRGSAVQPILAASVEAGSGELLHEQVIRPIPFDQQFPVNLFPGETRTLKWLQATPVKEEVLWPVTVELAALPKPISRTSSILVNSPARLVIESIAPAEKKEAYTTSEPLSLMIGYRNVGGVRSDPLHLVGQELGSGKKFSLPLPPLEAGQWASAQITVDASQTRFNWETRLELPPTALTSRTQWQPQEHTLEVPREWDIRPLLQGKTWGKKFDGPPQSNLIETRFLIPGETAWSFSDEARFKDVPVMSLDLAGDQDAFLVRSATHSAAAAWRLKEGWWLSPYQLQAHPTQAVPPLHLRMSWMESPVLALVAPTFHKQDNYQGLGFPMPGVSLETASGARFDLLPQNTQAGVEIAPALIEIASPGAVWTVTPHKGTWPGFAGFRLAYLPEIRTPILTLPDDGPWRPGMMLEWAGAIPREWHVEARSRSGGGEWSVWQESKSEGSFAGNQVQIRCWLLPDESIRNALIRSIEVSLDRNP
jgi:hypothetical protein